MKKTLKISLIVLLVILLGFSFWFFLLRNPDVPVGESLRDILPFGSGDGVNLPFNNNPPSTTGEEFGVIDGRPVAKLFRISEAPVAGFVILGENSSTTVRYTDRATGHIYDAVLETLDKTKVTNTTLPKIYEAYFNNDGSEVLYRSLKDDDSVENVSLSLTPPEDTDPAGLYTFTATVLRGDMREVAVGTGDTLYFVLNDTESINTSTFEGTSQRSILTTPFTNWRLTPSGTTLFAWTKASASTAGYVYTLNTTNGSLTKVLGPLDGLTFIARHLGGGMAYSYNNGDEIKLFAREAPEIREYEVSPTTLAEKCVWGTDRSWVIYCGVPIAGVSINEPDNWYKGMTHFSDRIWSFDTRVDIAEILSEPKLTYSIDMDVYEPQISPTEDYMVFINKNDLSLWALKLD